MAPLLTWGLPARSRDATLFGAGTPWPADRFRAAEALAARTTRPAGADTDLDPRATSEHVVNLTTDEADRAAILRRYRLFTRQPDEMITFMALQRMNPRAGDFDPRMYQYGGGYIYLVAAALAAAAKAGAVTLSPDVGVYLERPELFGQLYLVARGLSLAFGAAALAAVARLARQTGGCAAAWVAALLLACSPVFITAVTEAKPHLPSAALILWAIVAALAWRESPTWPRSIGLGLLAGYAFALVLTGLLAAALVPALLLATRMDARRRMRLTAAVALAAGVFAAANPFLLRNALFHRELLFSNLGNSTAMYTIGSPGRGAANVMHLLLIGVGAVTLLGGAAGGWMALRRDPRAACVAIAPACAFVVVAVSIGAGKPAEFARFLLAPAMLLAAGAGAVIARGTRGRPAARAACVALALVAATPWTYVRAIALDSFSDDESRFAAARQLELLATPDEAIAVVQEPAPYSIPPVDFTRRELRLLPARRPPDLDGNALPRWLVLTADSASSFRGAWWAPHYAMLASFGAAPGEIAPITWACKPTFIFEKRPAAPSAAEAAQR